MRWTAACAKSHGRKSSITHGFERLAFAHLKRGRPRAAADAFRKLSEYAGKAHVSGSGRYMIRWVHLGMKDRDAAATSWRSASIEYATAMDLSGTMVLRKDKVKRITAGG